MNLRRQVDAALRRIGHALLPPTCVLCGARGDDGRDLCAACAGELPHNRCCCPRCALPLATPAPLCGACLKRPPPFARALIPYRYDYPLDRLLTRFKFGADLGIGRVLSDLLRDAALEAPPAADALLVPVPLHQRRLAARGFNQSLELARLLKSALELEWAPRALTRIRATAAQTGLLVKARRQNVRRAFEASPRVKGRDVILLDDVVTTAATARECARALKRAGAARVELWAVARAPK